MIVGEQGRIVIPAEFRKKLALKPGDELMARVRDGQLILEELDHALMRVQDNIQASRDDKSVSGVEELLQERLREARKEREEIAAHSRLRRSKAS